MQSYSTFSVGGSVSVNAHGITTDYTVGESVLSMTVITWDGQEIQCSRTENPEWFRHCIGGYDPRQIKSLTKLRTCGRDCISFLNGQTISAQSMRRRFFLCVSRYGLFGVICELVLKVNENCPMEMTYIMTGATCAPTHTRSCMPSMHMYVRHAHARAMHTRTRHARIHARHARAYECARIHTMHVRARCMLAMHASTHALHARTHAHTPCVHARHTCTHVTYASHARTHANADIDSFARHFEETVPGGTDESEVKLARLDITTLKGTSNVMYVTRLSSTVYYPAFGPVSPVSLALYVPCLLHRLMCLSHPAVSTVSAALYRSVFPRLVPVSAGSTVS